MLQVIDPAGSPPRLLRSVLAAAFLTLAALDGAALGQSAPFRRGDVDQDGQVAISDAVRALGFLFQAEPSPDCDDAADLNDDGRLTVTDPIVGLLHLFQGGPAPPPPAEGCGIDPTEDALGCVASPPCAADPACLDEETVNGLLAGSLATEICIPAGIIEVPVDPFSVSVCPEAGAAPCGPLEAAGCPARLTSLAGRLDVEGRRLIIRVEGRMDDLPVDVEETVFGSTTTCQVDIHGADASLPFSFDVAMPLLGEEESPGVFAVSGVGEAVLEEPSLSLTVSGNLLCRLFGGAEEAFAGVILDLLAQTFRSLAPGLAGELTGLKLCAAPGD